MTEVQFPSLSVDKPEAEGVLVTWFVRDGESVTEGQVVAEVMVDKVSAEVSAPVSGVIHLLVEEEDAVVQGAAVARIE